MMTVGDLRKALEGVADNMEIVVRAYQEEEGTGCDIELCVGLVTVAVEYAHDEDDTPYFALDATNEEDT
jgi:hypothetical protein